MFEIDFPPDAREDLKWLKRHAQQEDAAMRTIVIPPTARRMNDLFRKARRKSLLLKSHEGDLFVLSPLEGWQAFEVGEDITENEELMHFLAERKRNAKRGRTYTLDEVKAELGIR